MQIPDKDETPTVIESVDRYKYSNGSWGYEYSLNNSGFTAAQWAAINSSVTSDDMIKLRVLSTRAEADHETAVQDNAQMTELVERADADHVRAESDHATYVDSLGAFDISSYHATDGVLAKYADLAAALGTNGANVPESYRRGGMSVKFVQSSDNKYVQYRLIADEWSTNKSDWQGVDDVPIASSRNLVLSGGIYVGDNYYGVKIGYFSLSGSILWVVVNNRATTKIINAVDSPLNVKVTGNVLIAGIYKFSTPFVRDEYISVNAQSYTASAGYYYAVTFKNSDNSDITIDDLVGNIFIGNDCEIYTNVSNLYQKVIEDSHKQILLAKWGTSGNPTDLQVGDYWTPEGKVVRKVLKIEDGVVASSEEINITSDTILRLGNDIYIKRGNYLTQLNKIVKIPYYGLHQGYYHASNISQSSTRVCTDIINTQETGISIQTEGDYFIKGYYDWSQDLSSTEYIIVSAKSLTLPANKLAEIVFSKGSEGTSNVTPSEIAPYIYVGSKEIIIKDTHNGLDTLTLAVGEQKLLDKSVFNASDVVTGRWYTGTSIGSTAIPIESLSSKSCIIDVLAGQKYNVTVKGGNAGRGWYAVNDSLTIKALGDASISGTYYITIPNDATKLIIQANDLSFNLGAILVSRVTVNEKDIAKLQSDFNGITRLKDTIDSFKALTPFVWKKLAQLKTLGTGFCNIGFIGDSWTQGTQNVIGGTMSGYAGYVEPLAKMLWEEYGFGGLGWLDFAFDGGGTWDNQKMFGCVDMYRHWGYSHTGTITGLDGHDDEQAPNCLGICCANIIFSNNATLSLTFDAGYLDKFKIRYYKNAQFSVSINNGTAVEVNANPSDGWQETEFGVTGTDITSVVITSLADNTIIFGMDCFYGTHGVRIHKIGNRSISASDYLLMNAAQWEEGIAKLELCWASILLAINDLGGSTDESRMNQIVTNISNLIDRLKVATNDGNGLVTCDINILGVENIEASGWTGLGRLAEKQKAFALDNGYGWCSTDKCIGSKKDEFIYNGTFSDTIHLNKIGSYAYAKHIYNSLFTF